MSNNGVTYTPRRVEVEVEEEFWMQLRHELGVGSTMSQSDFELLLKDEYVARAVNRAIYE